MKLQYTYHFKPKAVFLLLAFVLLFFLGSSTTSAQDSYPREFTNPDEIVAFDRSTSYVEAIEVINQFYQEYRNKFIIDQTGTEGQVGVSLPAMHWEDALNFILRLKNLTLVQGDDFVEIVRLSSLAEEEETGPGVNPNAANEINLKTREVRINATFFEGNRRALQEIGVDWSTLTSNVPEDLNTRVAGESTDPALGLPQAGYTDQFVSVNSFNAANVSQNVFNSLINFGEIGAGISVQALFSAFEADNLGEVLATPFTKVMDGQEGRVQVGQDFSIKQRDIAGNVTDQFFSTGTILTVTPQVIEINDTSFIHLDIQIERSSAQPDAVSTIINKQQASTQALLLDGEATTIAGLYRTDDISVRRGVPILKDLPGWFLGLRYLFGFNSTDYVENELIIIVQASLEKSLEQRATESFKTKRRLLDESRSGIRNGLDEVFHNNLMQSSTNTIPTQTQTRVVEPDTDDTVQEVMDEEPIQEPITQTEREESPVESDEANEASNTDEIATNTVNDEELTPEQRQIAQELTMPVDNPELMMVVPRAFSLEEYLTQKQNGELEPEIEADDASLKYFVIGGSFILKNFANRFNSQLLEEGYDTRILHHPTSRFNFVSYAGFSDFDEAVDYLKGIRNSVNNEAWLFIRPTK